MEAIEFCETQINSLFINVFLLNWSFFLFCYLSITRIYLHLVRFIHCNENLFHGKWGTLTSDSIKIPYF